MSPQLTVTAELRALLRRVKLGRCLDTLPERLTLAHQQLDRDLLERQLFVQPVQQVPHVGLREQLRLVHHHHDRRRRHALPMGPAQYPDLGRSRRTSAV